MKKRAIPFTEYLRNPSSAIFASIVEIDAWNVIFDLEVDLPQRPLNDVRKVERIRVTFSDSDEVPKAFVMRDDFPKVPHLISYEQEFPRQLCLYELPWQDEKASWTPSSFLERIRTWLSGTADGSLHRKDQPLEPLLPNSPFRLVLPPFEAIEDITCWTKKYVVSRRGNGKITTTFVCSDEGSPQEPDDFILPVLFVRMPVCQHGVISRLPSTLGELEEICITLGESLVDLVVLEMSKWSESLKDPTLENSNLMIVLCLPKTRSVGGLVETTEFKGYFIEAPIKELLESSTEYVDSDGVLAPRTTIQLENPEFLKDSGIFPLSVLFRCTRDNLARMNGCTASRLKVLGIGAGAIGGYVANNLIRKGFGEWTILDSDTLDPHNVSRHLLANQCVGFPKSRLMAHALKSVVDLEPLPTFLNCDYLVPGDDETKLEECLKDVELVIDMSASVAVTRALAIDDRTAAPRITLFLNQRGDNLVVLAEDKVRSVNSLWLESDYFRAVAFDARMYGHFDEPRNVAHRYGGSCREISSVVSNDDLTILAGIASRQISDHCENEKAHVDVFRVQADGGIDRVEITVSTPFVVKTGEWEVLIHPSAIASMKSFRGKRLPCETGGVLVGIVDRHYQYFSILEALPAPADSEEWPSCFIRGCKGLKRDVAAISSRTLENVVYVGEWHSHPQGIGAKPSLLDLDAIKLNLSNLTGEAMPAVMLIVSEDEVSLLFGSNIEGGLDLKCFYLGKDLAKKE